MKNRIWAGIMKQRQDNMGLAFQNNDDDSVVRETD